VGLARGRAPRAVSRFTDGNALSRYATNLAQEQAEHVVALDEALKILETLDARQSQIVEWLFFGGLSIDETGEVLNLRSACE
jgi:DNA-directed RNA polymerase specialized sigma24 family protein